MNLRTLKKVSKRAAVFLKDLGVRSEIFPCEPESGDCDVFIRDRKHWERHSASHGDVRGSGYSYQPKCRQGHRLKFIHVGQPWSPRKGTMMIGGMDGYYEPEWWDQTCYGYLRDYVFSHFTDWEKAAMDDSTPECTRTLNTPSLVFAAAREIVDEMKRNKETE